MTDHEETLRDVAAMFAMCALIMRGEFDELGKRSFYFADHFMQSRVPESGIAAIKPKKKHDAPAE